MPYSNRIETLKVSLRFMLRVLKVVLVLSRWACIHDYGFTWPESSRPYDVMRWQVFLKDCFASHYLNSTILSTKFEKIEVLHELGYVYRDIKP